MVDRAPGIKDGATGAVNVQVILRCRCKCSLAVHGCQMNCNFQNVVMPGPTAVPSVQALQQTRSCESHATDYTGGGGQQGSCSYAKCCWQTHGTRLSLRQGAGCSRSNTPYETCSRVVDLQHARRCCYHLCRCLGLSQVKKDCILVLLHP